MRRTRKYRVGSKSGVKKRLSNRLITISGVNDAVHTSGTLWQIDAFQLLHERSRKNQSASSELTEVLRSGIHGSACSFVVLCAAPIDCLRKLGDNGSSDLLQAQFPHICTVATQYNSITLQRRTLHTAYYPSCTLEELCTHLSRSSLLGLNRAIAPSTASAFMLMLMLMGRPAKAFSFSPKSFFPWPSIAFVLAPNINKNRTNENLIFRRGYFLDFLRSDWLIKIPTRTAGHFTAYLWKVSL